MTEPTTTCDDKVWDAIDIFLFSNGEQHSPPRKYHLNTKELRTWHDILANLGRSQFGSQHTNIEIYTTDGQKVEGTPQLSHQAAYVAVKPPYTFIQAGYEKYLIKATRSWEKRLLKITNSMESSVKDGIQNVIPKVELSANIDNGACYPSNNKDTSNTLHCNKNKRSIIKTPTVNTNIPQRCKKNARNCIPNKQVQIKKASYTPQVTTLKQTIMSFKTLPGTKRLPIKMKDSFYKKHIDIKKTFSATTKGKTTARKCDQNSSKVVPSTTITNLNLIEKREKLDASKKTNLNLQNLNEDKTNNSIVKEEEILINNIYNNPENEFLSVTDTKCDTTRINENSNNQNTDVTGVKFVKSSNEYTQNNCNKTPTSNAEINRHKNITSSTETGSSIQKPAIVSVEIQKSNSTNQSCCASLNQLGHFLTIINKDKIFKMQLNLEVKNCNVSMTTDQRKTIDKSHSIANIIKVEKETQVNIDEQLCENFEKNSINLSLLKKEDLRSTCDIANNIVNDEGKVIFINCSCCDCVDIRYLLQSNIECNYMLKEQFVHDLASAIKEGTERCECEKHPSKHKLEVCSKTECFINHNFEHLVEKPQTVTSVNKLASSDPISTPHTSTVTKEKMILHGETGNIDLTPECQHMKEFINRNTQTAWCNILLEARRHEDGRYTFHVPSLHKIKNMVFD